MTPDSKLQLIFVALTIALAGCSQPSAAPTPSGEIACRMESQRHPATLGNGIAIAYSDHVEVRLLPAPGADPVPVFDTSRDAESHTRTNQYAVLDIGEYTIEVTNPATGSVIETHKVNIDDHQYATIGIACTGGSAP
jgi:hypothetical protein